MVMDMLDMSVTLIVKAPNQQIEDQTIKCEPTWTIKKLKGYLSEVYPSKPRTEDQKLIYSGQLLPDSVILRDILRWYEGQEAHTLHLVCAPPRDRRSSSRPQPRMTEKRNPSALGENGVHSSASGTDSTDGLRQRLSSGDVPTAHPFTASTSSGQFRAPDPGATWAAAAAMAQPYGVGYDPNSMVQQLAMMQQAYAHYMAQYMQMLASGAGSQTGLNAHGLHPAQVTVPPRGDGEEPAPVIDNQVQEAGHAAADNANLLEGEDEGRGNRDWLYWFYFMSRLMVFFSIVYFYSSPTRFVIVAALGILIYLYQIGFFRIQQQQQQQQQHQEPQQQPQPQQRQVGERPTENNNVAVDDINNADHNEAEAQEPQRAVPHASGEPHVPDPEPDRPSLLALTWTFLSSFFASLIPEQPGAI